MLIKIIWETAGLCNRMKSTIIFLCGILAMAASEPCDLLHLNDDQLILSLNKKLLLSLEDRSQLPNPSIYIALRLSDFHNQTMENAYLVWLKTELHKNLESSLKMGKPVTGLLALYILALRGSCQDLNNITLNQKNIIQELEEQVTQEEKNIKEKEVPLTNYYQYSLGVLAQCVCGVHVRKELVDAMEPEDMKHGQNESVDTLAMAGMALQCVKESCGGQDDDHLQQILNTIKDKLLASQRPDGHMGNEFSTGLAVQALLAMHILNYSEPMEALKRSARNCVYHNPMAISQVLPALQHKSYLQLRVQQCTNEDNSLNVMPQPTTTEVLPVTVSLEVLVVIKENKTKYTVIIPKLSSLLNALTLLQEQEAGFTFETEPTLWGPFLTVVNGVQAQQSNRTYWNLSSDGSPLSEGIRDYKIQRPQKITIRLSTY
ncbi:transcobalamin-2-like isoform X1 [Arapaima gigas]